jgi:hypothetical protein
MNNYFLVKVKCSEQNEQGIFKRKVYSYLVFAHTFSEAETRIYEHFENFKSVTDLSISSIQRSDFHDIYEDNASNGFCVVKISFENHELDKSKRVTQKLLVTADTIEEATEFVMERLSITSLEYKIESVSVSPITDYLDLFEKNNANLLREQIEATSEAGTLIREDAPETRIGVGGTGMANTFTALHLTSNVSSEEKDQEDQEIIEHIILNK